MAKKNGLNGKAYISTDGGTTFVEIGNLKGVSIDEKVAMQESTDNSSGGYRDYLAGLGDWSGTADAFWNAANTGQVSVRSVLSGKTKVNFKFVDEEGTGFHQWTGAGFISGKNLNPVGMDGPIATQITIQGCGALTEGVQP